MKTKFFLAAFLALAAVCLPNYASAGLPEAVVYLKSQPQDAWITQALAAAGQADVPTSHLTTVAESSSPTTDYAKVILALAAAGKNPTTFGNIDYVAKLKTYYNKNQMGSDVLLNYDIWSILALASIKKTDSPEAKAAKDFLLAHQNADGGWGYDVGGASDTNDTAAAIMALIEMGFKPSDTVIAKAINYLQLAQNNDGGFTYDPNSIFGRDSDSSSDAWVISAIYKIGQDPADIAWVKNGNNPLVHMQTLQDAADGGFWWVEEGTSDWNNKGDTGKVVVALAGKSYPVGYFEISMPIRLSADKRALNSGESVLITVEYFDGEFWLALEGAAINGLDKNYSTDSSGQASAVLPAGEYSISAVKAGFITSEQVKITVSAPAPAPNLGGGSVISVVPVYCQNVEYDVWQELCADSWQYRNILNITPANCALTVEQEEQRKRVCVVAEEDEITENVELIPEVLGVKIASSSVEQPDEIAAEANEIVSGQPDNFIVAGSLSTIKLGSGERAGVLNSYKSVFGKLPETQTEWEDVIRISNSQLPATINLTAEERAKREFNKVYGREADLKNANDQATVNMIAYGLRPEKRDLNSERAGIRLFVKNYKYLPVSALDWDIIRGIAYGGVNL